MLGLLRSDFEAKEKIDGKWNHCIDYWYTTPDGERIDQNSEKAEKAHWEAVRRSLSPEQIVIYDQHHQTKWAEWVKEYDKKHSEKTEAAS